MAGRVLQIPVNGPQPRIANEHWRLGEIPKRYLRLQKSGRSAGVASGRPKPGKSLSPFSSVYLSAVPVTNITIRVFEIVFGRQPADPHWRTSRAPPGGLRASMGTHSTPIFAVSITLFHFAAVALSQVAASAALLPMASSSWERSCV